MPNNLHDNGEQLYENFKDIHHDSQGIICVSQITEGSWKNKYGRYKAMLSYIEELDSQKDIFFSQNTFKKFKRSTEQLLELKALYIDIDFYKHTNYTKDQIFGSIEILISDGKIPRPTHIVDSGNGLNLIWRIKRTPAQALPLWRTIEEYFYQQFKDFGADRKAMDVTRVFRPAGTVNGKYTQEKKVVIVYSNPIEYDIHHIQEYIHFPKKQSNRPKQSRTVVRLFNQYSLYYSRYMDILAICKLREYDVKGSREIILFLYRYYSCAYLKDNDLALQNAIDLNRQFVEPLSEIEVRRATASAEKAAENLKYGYRNSTLIELLEITEEEMAAQNNKGEYILTSIISKEEKYRRNNARRYKKRRAADGLTDEQRRQKELLERILKLRAHGMTQQQVADELNVNKRTIQKYERMNREKKIELRKTSTF